MTDFFQNIGKGVGPSYNYTDEIKSPAELGMSGKGELSVLGKDIGGLIAYTELLVQGGGKASKIKGPLGDKFFLKTGAKCTDNKTGNQVTRSIFINNIPDGEIPFISSGVGVNFTEFEGLIPGLLGNLAAINPLAIFSAFTTGTNPKCQSVTLETRNVKNVKSNETAFLTTDDIKSLNACLFPDKTNPISKQKCREGFSNNILFQQSNEAPANSDWSDIIAYTYYVCLLFLIIYIISKIKN